MKGPGKVKIARQRPRFKEDFCARDFKDPGKVEGLERTSVQPCQMLGVVAFF